MATLPAGETQRIVRRIGVRLKNDGYDQDFAPKYRIHLIAFGGGFGIFGQSIHFLEMEILANGVFSMLERISPE
ncbi:hypothetical protein [Desulfosarcina widdelii]|uniref:hypothetical protein n=1 Tax=Desulfosarcina widdelii TaxID=947919 RepID=UPI0012D36392|nr:hypothetical protein [Desulfosarcina widdelii]